MPIPAWDADLPDWLARITPLGAPALAMLPEGRMVSGPCPLPLTIKREPVDDGLWLFSMLASLELVEKQRLIDAEAREFMAKIMGGPLRPDGRPGWHPEEARHRTGALAWAYNAKITKADLARAHAEMEAAGSRYGAVAPRAKFRRGDRGLMRGIHLAVSQDLAGESDDWLSEIARLTDHKQFNDAGQGQPISGDHRSLRRLVRDGRRILELLGAWPWAHAEGGTLPPRWRTDAAFIEPLQAWHDSAVLEACDQIARNLRAFEGPAAETDGGSAPPAPTPESEPGS